MNYTFDIVPIGKPRMVRSDKWKHRQCVVNYFSYKEAIQLSANIKKFQLPDYFKITFCLPMPDSWSIKKRVKTDGEPHQQKPDLDNLLKGFMDALRDNDSDIHTISARKIWGTKGYIEIETCP